MFKKLNDIVKVSYPIDDTTAFRVEGYYDYYTIIDAITKVEGHETYVLLESNTYGEDVTLVIKMPSTLLKISRFDGKLMNVNNGKDHKQPYAIFIKNSYVICDDSAGNYLTETLEDHNIIDIEDKSSYVQWFSENINEIKFEE